MSAPYEHIPVLYEPVLEALAPRPGGRYIDATLGGGGHAAGILERCAPDGRLLGIDLDPAALTAARRRLVPFGQRATLVQGDLATLERLAREHGFSQAQGVLFDLGVSSPQLDHPERGFSFQADAPLDMRFSPTEEVTAADLVNNLEEDELADLIRRYGEERFARRIARRIVRVRQQEPILRTGQLAQLVTEATGQRGTRIHPATRTFLALRIAVNRELQRLSQGLEQAVEILAPGGRLVVISFHSLEDRLVKSFMRREEGTCNWPTNLPVESCPHCQQPAHPGARRCRSFVGASCTLPVRLRTASRMRRAGTDEVSRNPRARSARLRVAERVSTANRGGKP